MRRVLFVAWAPFFAGAERALAVTLGAMDRTRIAPVAVVGASDELAEALAGLSIPVHRIRLGSDKARTHPVFVSAVLRLAWLCRRHRVSLVHSNDLPSHRPSSYAARLAGVPASTHVRFPADAEGYRWFRGVRLSRALFVSDALRRDAMATAPDVFDGLSDVLHDGVRLLPAASSSERTALRRRLALPADVPVVALTGQVAVIKGIWEFLEAARLMCAGGSAAMFAVMGDDLKGHGALRRAMEAKVAALGLSSRFRFLGFQPDAPALLPAFDVIAVPSHVEPLGNATLEAMAAGVPVVGSRVGGIPEMIVDGATGLLVPPSDPGALASALETIVSDSTLREAMGAAARQRAATAFGLAPHAEALHSVFDAMCSPDSRR